MTEKKKKTVKEDAVLEIGTILENKDGVFGTITSLDENEVTIAWRIDENDESVIEEEVVALDEISKKTLGSYIVKASDSKAESHSAADRALNKALVSLDDVRKPAKTFIKRDAGIKTAVKKLAKEETVAESAADSLKPDAKPSDETSTSKLARLKAIIGAANSMTAHDFEKWWTSALETSKTYVPSEDKSAANQASIDTHKGKGPKTRDPMPKINCKEDVESLFDGLDLSEDFKERSTTLFESAVDLKVMAEVSRLEEEYENSFAEEIEKIEESLGEKLNAFMDYVAESWFEENKVAIESQLRNEMVSDFIDGMKTLFAEHYVEIPEDKADLYEGLVEKVEALESHVSELIENNASLEEALLESEKNVVINKLCEDLTFADGEKLASLSENIEYDDLAMFESKLVVIKEHHFGKKAPASTLDEEVDIENAPEETKIIDPIMRRYASALNKKF